MQTCGQWMLLFYFIYILLLIVLIYTFCVNYIYFFKRSSIRSNVRFLLIIKSYWKNPRFRYGKIGQQVEHFSLFVTFRQQLVYEFHLEKFNVANSTNLYHTGHLPGYASITFVDSIGIHLFIFLEWLSIQGHVNNVTFTSTEECQPSQWNILETRASSWALCVVFGHVARVDSRFWKYLKIRVELRLVNLGTTYM